MTEETNREKALRGEVVRVSAGRLREMQSLTVLCEGIAETPVYHWHFAAALNELAALRKIVAAAARLRGINLTPADGRAEHE